ncbi:hypothetical protein CVT26_009321 [Gymnopilus dilepis]|uniref:F-box domain-containing protein n=1 Tax=Gymnopilus dilepis TaxID=231916 RepID=A0A409YA41_9AGAR|nr:hypothetical protein CVT26_009321 [Gymnopilus dilepis]
MVQRSTLSVNWVIQNVPSEIWRSIFDIFYHHSSIKTASVEILRLSHVCSLWRATINGSPELWTKVSLEERFARGSHWSSLSAEFLSLILSRSGDRRLIMALESPTSPSSLERRGTKPIKTFMQAMDRAKELMFDLKVIDDFLEEDPDLFTYLVEESPTAHLLEDLTLDVAYASSGCAELLSKIFGDAVLLRSASFLPSTIFLEEFEVLVTAYFPFSQLTTLEAKMDIDVFFELLSFTPLLVTVSFEILEGDGFEAIEGTNIVRLDMLKNLTLRATLDEDEVESDIEGQDEDEDDLPDPMMRLLEYIVSPALTTLSLCFWRRRWSLDAFRKFMDRSSYPRIENLRLDVTSGSQEDKLECLKMLPHLRTLRLTLDHYVEQLLDDEYISREFFSSMRQRDDDAGEFVICPRLQKLAVGYNAIDIMAVTMLADMIEERWRFLSSEGKNFELVVKDAHELMEEENLDEKSNPELFLGRHLHVSRGCSAVIAADKTSEWDHGANNLLHNVHDMVELSALSVDWIIRNVPSEIWRSIFDIFYRDSPIETSSLDILHLSHVCSPWRTMINNSPEYWTKVSLKERFETYIHWTFPNSELLSLILRRSRDRPLTMALQSPDSPWGLKRCDVGPIKMFMNAVGRAKELALDMIVVSDILEKDPTSYRYLVAGLPAARVLEHLTLDVADAFSDCVDFLWKIFADTPLLRSASFVTTDLSFEDVETLAKANFPFAQLAALTMKMDMKAFFELLSLTPSLTTATFDILEGYGFDAIDDARIVRLEALMVLTLRATLTLQEYQVEEDQDENDFPDPMMRLLEYVVSPALTTLSLCFSRRRWSLEAFRKFMARSSHPRIEHLRIDVTTGSQEDKLECLKMLPHLWTLCVIDHYVERLLDGEYITGEFFLALQKWDGGAGEFVICPQLEKFVVDYDALHCMALTMLVGMVEDRWRRRSSEGKNFELVITDADELMGEGGLEGRLIYISPLLSLKDRGLKLQGGSKASQDPTRSLAARYGSRSRPVGNAAGGRLGRAIENLRDSLIERVYRSLLSTQVAGPRKINWFMDILEALEVQSSLCSNFEELVRCPKYLGREAGNHWHNIKMVQYSTLSANWVIVAVPYDVWRYIFNIFHHESPVETSAIAILHLSHVCSSWRSIINNAKELWTKVALKVHYRPHLNLAFPDIQLLSLILSRSGDRPLAMALVPQYLNQGIRIEGPVQPPSKVFLSAVRRARFPVEPIKVFLQAIWRAKALDLNLGMIDELCEGQPEDYEALVKDLRPAYLLEHLALDEAAAALHPCTQFISKLFADSPLLCTVCFDNYTIYEEDFESIKSAGFPFRQITALTMKLDIDAIFEVLSCTPALVTASFAILEESWFDAEDPRVFNLEALQDLTLRVVLNTRHIGNDIDDDEDEDDCEPAMRLLEHIIAPALTRLSLCLWGRRWSLDAFQRFMDNSLQPRIEHFRLDVTSGWLEDKLECLKMLPCLQILRLTIDNNVEKLTDDYSIGEDFCTAMREIDTGTGDFLTSKEDFSPDDQTNIDIHDQSGGSHFPDSEAVASPQKSVKTAIEPPTAPTTNEPEANPQRQEDLRVMKQMLAEIAARDAEAQRQHQEAWKRYSAEQRTHAKIREKEDHNRRCDMEEIWLEKRAHDDKFLQDITWGLGRLTVLLGKLATQSERKTKGEGSEEIDKQN